MHSPIQMAGARLETLKSFIMSVGEFAIGVPQARSIVSWGIWRRADWVKFR